VTENDLLVARIGPSREFSDIAGCMSEVIHETDVSLLPPGLRRLAISYIRLDKKSEMERLLAIPWQPVDGLKAAGTDVHNLLAQTPEYDLWTIVMRFI